MAVTSCWGQPSLLSVPGALTLGVKRPMCEADHSSPPSADFKNAWALLSLPNTPSWQGQLFTLTCMKQCVQKLHLLFWSAFWTSFSCLLRTQISFVFFGITRLRSTWFVSPSSITPLFSSPSTLTVRVLPSFQNQSIPSPWPEPMRASELDLRVGWGGSLNHPSHRSPWLPLMPPPLVSPDTTP